MIQPATTIGLSLEGLLPPPRLTVSEWAEQNRRLSSEAAAEPGPWRNARTPYLVGVMDAWNDPEVEDIVFKKSAQVGYTECLNNIVGYVIEHDPGPMLVLQPSLDMAKTFTTDRFDPMVRDSPSLERKVAEEKSRDKSNTTFHKTFPDGHMTVIGANSSAGLKSRPIRFLIGDEIDEYPLANKNSGDPVEKAKKRTTTFKGRRKRIFGSTPTIEDSSRVDEMYKASDQRKYFVPCPHCGHKQVLIHANLVWDDGDPETARYLCEDCGALIDHFHKADMLAKGEWRATSEKGQRGVAGFWINELYSPFSSWEEYATNFLKAAKLPETLQTFVNESMGETWSEEGSKIEAELFADKVEDYELAPEQTLLILMTVDTQPDRLEWYVKAWGLDFEGWGLDHGIIEGDPDKHDQGDDEIPTVWERLDDLRRKIYLTEDGRRVRIAATYIDAGGANTDSVYRYAKSRKRERVNAIRGLPGKQPVLGTPTRKNKHRVTVQQFGVNTIKSKLFKRLQIKEPGPGYQHYNRSFDDEWFKQLTAEKRKTKKIRGFEVVEWVKRRDRNEAWDLEVYQIGGLEHLNPNWTKLHDRAQLLAGEAGSEETGDEDFEPEPEPPEPPPAKVKRRSKQPKKRRGGFAQSWRA